MKNKDGHCHYPALTKLKEVGKVEEAIDLTKMYQAKSSQSQFHAKPLEGNTTVNPRFWNTFAAKILFINTFFAADQNF